MKRRLILMRHAKSSWADPGMDDFDRPLNHRGTATAPRVGAWLKERGWTPDRILSSPAVRAKQTTELASSMFGDSVEIEWLPDLYLAPRELIRNQVGKTDAMVGCLMIVAHNPGLEEFVNQIVGGYEAFPTAAVACFEADGLDWQLVTDNRGWILSELYRPKENL